MKTQWTAATLLLGACSVGCDSQISLGSPGGSTSTDRGIDASVSDATAGGGEVDALDRRPDSSAGGSIPDATPDVSPPPNRCQTMTAPTGWIAFDSDQVAPRGILFSPANSSGNERYSLWTSTAEEIEPAFSPDGTRIAYTSYASGVPQISIRQFATGTVTQLTHLAGGAHGAAWSRDGSLIAFLSQNYAGFGDASFGPSADAYDDFYVVTPDGTGLRDVSNSMDSSVVGTGHSSGLSATVTFGADTTLVFALWGAIDTMALDGTGFREIVGDANGQEGAETPSVSPDGTEVAFANWNPNGEVVLTTSFTTDATDPDDGGMCVEIVGGGPRLRALHPAWGPSGFMAFENEDVATGIGSISIFSVSPTSNCYFQPMSPPTQDDRNPAWAPDSFVPPGIADAAP